LADWGLTVTLTATGGELLWAGKMPRMLANCFTASFLSSYGSLGIFWKCTSAGLSLGIRRVLTFAVDR